jgi:hypothetical protein
MIRKSLLTLETSDPITVSAKKTRQQERPVLWSHFPRAPTNLSMIAQHDKGSTAPGNDCSEKTSFHNNLIKKRVVFCLYLMRSNLFL